MYDEGLRALDDELGAFFDRLEPYLDTTWVAITADHGEEFGEHGAWEHGHAMYDELVRLPLIVAPPASWQVAPARVGKRPQLQ